MAAVAGRGVVMVGWAGLAVVSCGTAFGQGCILARSPEQSSLSSAQGGYLPPRHFQVTIGERHQFSYHHYIGDVYQEIREQAWTQV